MNGRLSVCEGTQNTHLCECGTVGFGDISSYNNIELRLVLQIISPFTFMAETSESIINFHLKFTSTKRDAQFCHRAASRKYNLIFFYNIFQ